MYTLDYAGHWKLKHVPPGSLFRTMDGSLGLMTEYGGKAYLLNTGETCCVAGDEVVIVLSVSDRDDDEFNWFAWHGTVKDHQDGV